jgi:PKD repeat protein
MVIKVLIFSERIMMIQQLRGHPLWRVGLIFSLLLILAACNLGAAPEPAGQELTPLATTTAAATRTLQADTGVTVFPTLTPVQFATRPPIGQQVTPFIPQAATPIIFVPSRPTSTPLPVSIVVVSPLPGYIVSGNVQVVGSAIHPSFLQYRLEYGPDPNPNNLWFSITGIVNTPVLAGTLGVWSTNNGATPDGTYQLRLRVFLRDGSQQTTQVGNIRVQNRQPTPVPTNTTVPAPIAAFTQDVTQGNAPLVVRFTNRSQGQISNFTWNFGDGGSSSQANPAYTYQRPGTYTVTLRVAGPGGIANVSRQIFVQSPTAPDATFTTNVNSGTAPLTVNFTNTSTGQISTVEWDFGDGTTSTERNATHVYNDVGTYNVILRVNGPGGSDAVVGQITVENPSIPAPQANFEPSVTSGQTPLTVGFTNNTTGNVDTYLWDFNGDGITDSTEGAPSHIYTTAGTYTVRLIAIGPGGQSTALREITVQAPPSAPVADFSAAPETGTVPLAVQFTNETTGNATSYSWDFNNDGTPDSTAQSPQHTYSDAGTYTVILTATGAGGSSAAQMTISVQPQPQPPNAGFVASPNVGQAPLSVQFTNQSEGSQLTFAWDFTSDGRVDSAEQNPAFIYDTPGNYTVTLSVTNPAGLSDLATGTVQVSEVVVQVPPTAAFGYNPQTGSVPLTVTFVNQTTGEITGYEWDFNEDGVVDSRDTSPSFEFVNEGVYTVTLTAIGPGGRNSISSDVTVTAALQPPDAQFAANPTSGQAPLTVTFTNTSQGQIDSYSWDFNGDGTADSTEQSPTFQYPTAGNFNASLTVTNDAGSDTISAPITVTEALQAPVANFSASPTSGTAPLTVTFTNASEGQIDSYSWDFNGDGTPDSTEQSPTFQYPTAGNFNATLTVTNAAGSDTIAAPIAVTEALQAPVANFSANPTSGTAPLTVTFTDSSQGQIDSYSWDFNGDGTPDSTEQSPTFQYPTAGNFNATLTVTNATGSDTISAPITVTEALQAPVANFSANPTSGTAPLTVTFTNASEGQIDSYSWDFNGDGTPDSTEQSPTFQYPTAGNFNATLTVTNDAGSDTIAMPIAVTEALQAPVANFSANPTSGEAPLTVTFTDSSQGQIDSYSWDFNGDGTADSAEQSPTFQYPTSGNFDATLTVTNDAGSDTISIPIAVLEALQAPVANFSANPTSGSAPLTVTFTNASEGQIDSYSWDFNGDGTADSTEQSPTFQYPTAGNFNATLTVTNTTGSDTIAVPIAVTEALQSPVANFSANPTSGTAPLTVTFTDSSQGQIDSYSWDFNGDGTPDSTEQSPTFQYPTAGNFNATLTVTNDAGSDTIAAPIAVTEALQAPVANFSANPTSGEAPLTVTFTDSSQGQIDSYSWDFNGDGTPDSTEQSPTFEYPTAGNFNVTLTVANTAGSNTATTAITVTEAAVVITVPAITGNIVMVSNRDGNNDLYVINTDNSWVNLTNNGANDAEPAWSPDGSQIAFISDRDGNYEIYVLDISDLSVTRLTNDGETDVQPAWSPDGSQIAFVSNRFGDNDIFLMNADGSNQVQRTTDTTDDRFPTWSPDGSQLAYVADDGNGNDDNIYIINSSDGSGATQLTTDPADDTMPNWSSDDVIAYVSNKGGTGDNNIYTMNTDGSGEVQLTTATSNDRFPRWSEDGNRILYTSDLATDGSGNTADHNIYTMNPEGSGQQPITTEGSNEIQATEK